MNFEDDMVRDDEVDAYKNSRFKLIPYTFEGSWTFKQSVGNILNFRLKHYLILDLEDKVHFNEGGNVMNLNINAGQ